MEHKLLLVLVHRSPSTGMLYAGIHTGTWYEYQYWYRTSTDTTLTPRTQNVADRTENVRNVHERSRTPSVRPGAP